MPEAAVSPRGGGGYSGGRPSFQVWRTSTTAPRYLSGDGNADPLPACACDGLSEGSTVAMVVEGEEGVCICGNAWQIEVK